MESKSIHIPEQKLTLQERSDQAKSKMLEIMRWIKSKADFQKYFDTKRLEEISRKVEAISSMKDAQQALKTLRQTSIDFIDFLDVRTERILKRRGEDRILLEHAIEELMAASGLKQVEVIEEESRYNDRNPRFEVVQWRRALDYIASHPDSVVSQDTIVGIVKRGFFDLEGKLIRPARVVAIQDNLAVDVEETQKQRRESALKVQMVQPPQNETLEPTLQERDRHIQIEQPRVVDANEMQRQIEIGEIRGQLEASRAETSSLRLQITELTQQVTHLRDENERLRKQLDATESKRLQIPVYHKKGAAEVEQAPDYLIPVEMREKAKGCQIIMEDIKDYLVSQKVSIADRLDGCIADAKRLVLEAEKRNEEIGMHQVQRAFADLSSFEKSFRDTMHLLTEEQAKLFETLEFLTTPVIQNMVLEFMQKVLLQKKDELIDNIKERLDRFPTNTIRVFTHLVDGCLKLEP